MNTKELLTWLGISIVAALIAHWLIHKLGNRVDDEMKTAGATAATAPNAGVPDFYRINLVTGDYAGKN